jgi:uncharacterized protein YprB with RNaseH-like and TPR domain
LHLRQGQRGQTFSEALQGEMILIDAFLEWLDRRPPGQYTLVTCNGKHFDVPFILARLALARTLKDTYYLSILEYDHFDLAKLTIACTGIPDAAIDILKQL